MGKNNRKKLERAQKERRLVSFISEVGDFEVEGYILDVGTEFVLVAPVTDRIHYDGLECFFVEDVTELIPHANADFIEAALEKRNAVAPEKPELRLTGLAELITDAALAFPLLTFDSAMVDPEVSSIGRVLGIEDDCVKMLLIDSNARWDAEPRLLPLEAITRIGFGGDYEEALYLVGGEPPPPLSARPRPRSRKGPPLQ